MKADTRAAAECSHRVSSFAPIEGAGAEVLVLGTMPGTASLQAQRYYAHPRNAFWPILLGWLRHEPADRDVAAAIPYAKRVSMATEAGIAVWDVLAHCHRPGSLDSAIERASEHPNDIAGLLERHPDLRRIVFNGRLAARLFERHIGTVDRSMRISLHPAPSTSPAMASMTLPAKQAAWCEALGAPPAHGAHH